MASLDTIKLLALDALDYDPSMVIAPVELTLMDGSHRHGAYLVVPSLNPAFLKHECYIDYGHTIKCTKGRLEEFAQEVKAVNYGKS